METGGVQNPLVKQVDMVAVALEIFDSDAVLRPAERHVVLPVLAIVGGGVHHDAFPPAPVSQDGEAHLALMGADIGVFSDTIDFGEGLRGKVGAVVAEAEVTDLTSGICLVKSHVHGGAIHRQVLLLGVECQPITGIGFRIEGHLLLKGLAAVHRAAVIDLLVSLMLIGIPQHMHEVTGNLHLTDAVIPVLTRRFIPGEVFNPT
jgi:hypothetical protein